MTRPAAAVLLAASLLLVSCDPIMAPLPYGMQQGAQVQHVPWTGSFTWTLSPTVGARTAYFVFTNPDLIGDVAQGPGVKAATISVDGRPLPTPSPLRLPSMNSAPRSLTEQIAEFNRDPSPYLRREAFPAPLGAVVSGLPAESDQEGLTAGTFVTKIDANGDPAASVAATCRKVVGPLSLPDGRKATLSVWVEDTVWDSGELSQPKVNALAQRMLDPTSLDDIYHWDTAVGGQPWGPHVNSRYIPWDGNNTITMFLGHLNADYAPGNPVIVGYFYAKDAFKVSEIPGSNQRIMFYADSYLFSQGGDLWMTDAPWPSMVFSTLAHEMQHMIQFYQKQVYRGTATGADTWINEMCSMIMEDLVANKLGVEGPRGVKTPDAGPSDNVLGRLGGPSGFTQNASTGLTMPGTYDPVDYAVAYAFGAWLARNYGGADLLRRIIQSSDTNSAAVTNAVESATGQAETLGGLLERWAAAVLLSDTMTAPPGYRYNTGGWITSTSGGLAYSLGSIDMFRYSPALSVLTDADLLAGTTLFRSSNVYYQAASILTAPHTWQLTIPDGIRMSVVLK